ncbi:prephenate dehydratase [Alkalihalophilus pseudofirmus OF4]|uniref:Prephenate dehydratase n=2 Tax=Alkalihalophilus pseudofirmus TaxID=79885 RepID=D3FVU8_ALKPO|nr:MULTISPECIES: prephenate dehydratase [Alkalihalophilus]ADC50380.1 prephenate dehydratase [Alkalihalophilus pseudofirmus OF4]MDV2886926.1 prephenate dehydratase [Alkalihalophilus pseudofirmus]MED1600659.1 prephenate dehydratase [Alkalihalophilus marmarensis]
MKVSYLGPVGTFTEMAAKAFFPLSDRVPFKTIPACIEAVAEDACDACVVPIENTIEGSVNMTIDYLVHKQRLPIMGTITIPIAQHLLMHPKQAGKTPEKIISHPHAIAQCHDYLQSEYSLVDTEFMNSTAEAAQMVANHPNRPIAAIANELAASEYELDFVGYDIHDYNNNHTRFIVLAKEETKLKLPALNSGYKTTLMVTLPSDYSGALHQVLSAFAWRKLNLSKIESRPTKTGLGNYFFLIDVDQLQDDVLIPGVKSELEALGCGVDILGSYPCVHYQHQSKKTSPTSC